MIDRVHASGHAIDFQKEKMDWVENHYYYISKQSQQVLADALGVNIDAFTKILQIS